jgi:MFS transporter, FSR family, fosmidomycin resistance protein
LRRAALWAAPAIARAPYALVAALMFVRFADEWFSFFPAGVLEPMRAGVGLSYSQGGAVLVALAGGGLVGVAFEVAADYVSRRALAALGALAYGLAMIAFGLADSFLGLVAAAFVWGAASDAFIHGCEVALVDLAGEDLPRVLARVNAWAAVGDLLAPLTLTAAMAAGLGWRGAFIGGGVLMIGYAAWLGAQRFPPPRPSEAHANPLTGLWAVLRDGRVWVLAAIASLFDILDEPLLGFTIAYLERVRGFAPAMATSLALGAVAGGVVGYLIAERIVRGRSLNSLLIGSGVAMCATLPVMVFTPGVVMVVLGGLAFGIAAAVFYTALQSACLTVRPGQAGSTGAVISAIGLGSVGFPVVAGEMADRSGLPAALWLYMAVPVAILVLAVAARGMLRAAPKT